MKFSDLKFKKREHGDGIGCHIEINGFVLSVQASSMNYCSPRMDLDHESEYISFEIAIWDAADPREWKTREFVDVHDDIAAYMSRNEIESIMNKLIEYRHEKLAYS